jgi:hypothetical protein
MYETLQEYAKEDIMAGLYPQVRGYAGRIDYVVSIDLDGLELPRLRVASKIAENGGCGVS